MSSQALQLFSGVLVAYGAALCFAGYRIFRACLAVAGLAVGLWAGLLLATELMLEDLPRIFIVSGVALLCAALAAAVFLVGVFLTGGAALGGLVLLVTTRLGYSVPAAVLAGLIVLGGVVAVLAHRKLVVFATSLVGALLVVVGVAPLVLRAQPPDTLDAPWLRVQVEALPAAWLVGGVGLAVLGVFVQTWGRRRRYGLSMSRAQGEVLLPHEAAPPRRSRSRAVPESRTHGAICPRCGSIVDVDALFCHQCGNDRW